jgi:hypothetical protein
MNCYNIGVSDTVHLFSMDERKTNLMHLAAASTRFAPPPPAQRPQLTAQNTYATNLVF